MKELSLHILDITQNSIQAGATLIEIEVIENSKLNIYNISIEDNGKGMCENELKQVFDPFYTSKDKKTGLGLPLLKQHTEMAGGNLQIISNPGIGTKVIASFQLNHFDRQPMGHIAQTIVSIVRANPELDFVYRHKVNSRDFSIDTREIKSELGKIPITSSEVMNFLEEMIRDNLCEMNAT
jgi:hypothetical protein